VPTPCSEEIVCETLLVKSNPSVVIDSRKKLSCTGRITLISGCKMQLVILVRMPKTEHEYSSLVAGSLVVFRERLELL
jgi:hypothetical protein